MLATQLNHVVDSGTLGVNCIIRMNEFLPNLIANRKIIIILNLEVVSSAGAAIGAPVNIDSNSQPMNNVAPRPQPVAPIVANPRPTTQFPNQFAPAPVAHTAPKPFGFSSSSTGPSRVPGAPSASFGSGSGGAM